MRAGSEFDHEKRAKNAFKTPGSRVGFDPIRKSGA
jgi:hypothetical protein